MKKKLLLRKCHLKKHISSILDFQKQFFVFFFESFKLYFCVYWELSKMVKSIKTDLTVWIDWKNFSQCKKILGKTRKKTFKHYLKIINGGWNSNIAFNHLAVFRKSWKHVKWQFLRILEKKVSSKILPTIIILTINLKCNNFIVVFFRFINFFWKLVRFESVLQV